VAAAAHWTAPLAELVGLAADQVEAHPAALEILHQPHQAKEILAAPGQRLWILVLVEAVEHPQLDQTEPPLLAETAAQVLHQALLDRLSHTRAAVVEVHTTAGQRGLAVLVEVVRVQIVGQLREETEPQIPVVVAGLERGLSGLCPMVATAAPE
jgi:hypothetical protein